MGNRSLNILELERLLKSKKEGEGLTRQSLLNLLDCPTGSLAKAMSNRVKNNKIKKERTLNTVVYYDQDYDVENLIRTQNQSLVIKHLSDLFIKYSSINFSNNDVVLQAFLDNKPFNESLDKQSLAQHLNAITSRIPDEENKKKLTQKINNRLNKDNLFLMFSVVIKHFDRFQPKDTYSDLNGQKPLEIVCIENTGDLNELLKRMIKPQTNAMTLETEETRYLRKDALIYSVAEDILFRIENNKMVFINNTNDLYVYLITSQANMQAYKNDKSLYDAFNRPYTNRLENLKKYQNIQKRKGVI